jgi:hypothetical protein
MTYPRHERIAQGHAGREERWRFLDECGCMPVGRSKGFVLLGFLKEFR